MKKLNLDLRRSNGIQRAVLTVLLPGLVLLPADSHANPSGGVVTSGTIEFGDGLGGQLVINQLSHKAIINWDSFSIASGELTRFAQPGKDSAALNRVVSGNPSAIHGALQANGKLFLINPNGIMVGPGGSIDTSGLVLSTLDLSDADFLAGGDLIFRGDSGAGVQNFGRVSAIGGDVFLIGNSVSNAGSVSATGSVGLAAGEEVLVTANPDAGGERVFVRPVGSGGGGTGIDNSGSIQGAAVELKAHGNLYALAINNSGSIRATGASRGAGGVYLRAPGGRVDQSGSIRATVPGGDGGRILIEGAILNAGGDIDASASTQQGQGGEVTLSGEEISVSGRIAADGHRGGSVVIGSAGSVVNVASTADIGANGIQGEGGSVRLAGNRVNVEAGARIEAIGATDGGTVLVNGGSGSSVVGGSLSAVGESGNGGQIQLLGEAVTVAGEALIDASGAEWGGRIYLGGGFQGGGGLAASERTVIERGASISSNGRVGGTVVAWSDGDTTYLGDISARGVERGGLVEVSGKRTLEFDGGVNAGADSGEAGILLLDPTNITINTAVSGANNVQNSALQTALSSNHVVISTQSPGLDAGWISVEADVRWHSAYSLTLLAEDSIYVARDLRGDGIGNVNLIAGWDSANFVFGTDLGSGAASTSPFGALSAGDVDMASVFDNWGLFGNNRGSVVIGRNESGTLLGNGIDVGSRLGNTSVVAHDLCLLAGNGTTSSTHAQLGFRGDDGDGNLAAGLDDARGDIRVQLKGDLVLRGGLGGGPNANNGQYAYAKIGHGGDFQRSRDKEMTGDILIEARGGVTATAGVNRGNFVQIGHGGFEAGTTTASLLTGGDITVLTDESITFSAGTGLRAYAQIGHGGYDMDFETFDASAITVRSGGDIAFSGGTGLADANSREAYAMIGHGGRSSNFTLANGEGYEGDILVEAGRIGVVAPGVGGASGAISFLAGSVRDNFVQIGHGGTSSTAAAGGGFHQGSITVRGTDGITFVAGTNSITETDDARNQAQIGHGGHASDPNNAVYASGVGHRGNILVETSGGDIFFGGGDAARVADASTGALASTGIGFGKFHFAQLGHGGYASDGDHSGSITIRAGVDGTGTILDANSDISFMAGNSNDDATDLITANYTQLGHGGYLARGDNGLAGDEIRVSAGGDITFRAGASGADESGTDGNRRSYAQLGNGGMETDQPNNNAGGQGNFADIHVTAGGDLEFSGGADQWNYGQLGNGGGDVKGPHSGIIDVRTGGAIRFLGGLGDDTDDVASYAQLGHGGREADGTHSGDISVRAGDFTGLTGGGITFKAGNIEDNYVQLGHGGYSVKPSTATPEGLSGNISVRSVGSILFQAGTQAMIEGTSDGRLYAQLGHGGYDADHTSTGISLIGAPPVGHHGDIQVIATSGDISFLGGDTMMGSAGDGLGRIHYAQLGHGGYDARGDHYGNIDVRAGVDASGVLINSGSRITFAAGSSNDDSLETYNYAQLGHGGAFARGDIGWGDEDGDGNPDGDIRVVAGGDILLRGGQFFDATTTAGRDENRRSYVQIGHGGFDTDNANPGNDAASILMPDGNTYLFDGYGIGGPTADERRGNQGNLFIESIDGGFRLLAGQTHDNYGIVGHGGGTSQGSSDGDHVGNITLLADIDGSHRASGGGNVQFWVDDPSDANLTDNIYDRRYVQLGHGGHFVSGGHVGDIGVDAGNGIDFRAGGGDSYAQLGHGGRNDHRLNYAGVTSTTSFDQDTDGRYDTVGVSNQTPPDDRRDNANDRYFAGTHTGDITVTSWGNVTFTGYSNPDSNDGGLGYAQLGHGGFRNAADPLSANGQGHNGDITLLAGGLTFGGDGLITAAQNPGATITFESGMQNFSYAQVGHGGYEAFGNHSGEIVVAAAAGVDFHARGGSETFTDNRSGQYSYLQIGHGGLNAEYGPYLPRALESTSNTVGNVFSENPANNPYYAFVTGGGTHLPGTGDFDGDTIPDATGQGSLMPLTSFYQTYVDPATVRFVDHDLNPATPMIPIVPTNRGQWFHINAPGAPMGADGEPILGNSGNVSVLSLTGDIDLKSTPATSLRGREEYVQVGHGGLYTGGDHSGDIRVIAQAGNVNLLAGQALTNDQGLNSYAQIGHGGSWSGGTVSGDIAVAARGTGHQVTAIAGADNQAYVQIGHGGYDASFLSGAANQLSGPDANGVTQSDTRALQASPLELRGFNLIYWYNPGFIRRTEYVTPFGDNALAAGAGIEHRRSFTGDISVEADAGIHFAGSANGTVTGNIAPGAYAQIGHGGRSTEADTDGDIFVNAGSGAVLFDAGQSNQSYVQLGHGGYESDGNKVGKIDVLAGIGAAGEGVEFRAGSRPDAYAMLGHGGTGAKSARRDASAPTVPLFQGNAGNISVSARGDITFVAGTGNYVNSDEDGRIYAQLGHGGYDADVHGVTTVDVFATGIGHNGDITVSSSDGRIFFAAGDTSRADNPSLGLGEGRFHFAHLGHGGYEARGEHFGNIAVDAASDIIFLGGSSEDNDADRWDFAQLGHGGGIARGDMGRAGESIDVAAGGDIVFTAGNSQASYAQLGNGGREARGDHQADIFVSAGGDIRFSAVQGRHTITDEEKNSDLSRATNNGTQTSDNVYTLEGSNAIPGTIVITIPGGPTLGDDGLGGIVVTGGNLDLDGDTVDDLTLGQVVASIVYTSGLMTFNTDVNPNNVATPSAAALTTVSYQSLEIATSYAQIGHGGYDADNGANTTLGNQGYIGIDAGGDVVFSAGVGAGAYAQVGHGGYATVGRNTGDIVFGTDRDGLVGTDDDRIGGAISFTGGQGEYFAATNAYARIGHGGRDSSGTNTGDIILRSTTGQDAALAGVGVQMRAGTREDAAVQIGHGGVNGNSGLGNGAANMEGHSGDITIDTHGSVNLIAGVLNMAGAPVGSLNNDGRLYAMIGHGGYDADTSLDGAFGYGDIGHHGDITVISREGDVNILAGDETRAFLPSLAPTASPFDATGVGKAIAGGRFHWAMIGHGGYVSSGNHHGNIVVHAGYDADAMATGNGGNDVNLYGGRNGADDDSGQDFAQIGHAGRSANGNVGRADEIISVMANGDVTIQGGDGTDAYAQIGHGGTNARGDRLGDIQVFAEGDVNLLASRFSATPALGDGIVGRYFYNVTSVNNNRFSLDRAADLVAGDGQVAGGALFRQDRIIPGSVSFEIFDEAGNRIGEVADVDGNGSLTVVADFSADMNGDTVPETFTAGQVVGNFVYTENGTRVDFTTDINPGADGGVANIVANFEYARTDRAYAQIGHGGYDADNPDGNIELGDVGNISVAARTGDITARAGTDSRSYAQFGHGGYATKGASSGDITLRAGGDIALFGGTGSAVDDDKSIYTMVGHGGWDADATSLTGVGHSGAIRLSSGSGVLATAGIGDGTGDFSDLGDFNRDGTPDVIAFGADVSGNAGGVGSGVGILLQGGSGTANDDDTFAMVGHGGRSSDGAHEGEIGVSATHDIRLAGGTGYRSWAQIGHGGLASNGNLSGEIAVISTGGSVDLAAGTGTEAYAMIGHGDDRVTDATLNSTGTRSGDIHVQAADWSLAPVGGSVAQIGHRSRNANQGLVAPTNLQLIATGLGAGVNTLTDVIRDATVLPYLNSGGDVVFGGINLLVDSTLGYNSTGSLTFLSTQGTTFQRSVQNSGAGAVNVLAGWDRVSGFDQALNFADSPPWHVFDYDMLKNDLAGGGAPDWFGAGPLGDEGAIVLDATGGAIAVGSSLGETNLAGHGVFLTGGDGADEYAQVGFRNTATVASSGGIRVDTKEGGLSLAGGTAARAYSQVGHGGNDANIGDTDASQQGMIAIDVTHGTAPGALTLQGGDASESYAQIGHGGRGQQGNHGGDLTIVSDQLTLNGGAGDQAYAQLGHGGDSGAGNLSGNLTVTSSAPLAVNGGNGSGAYAQIGLGGKDHQGGKTGDILLNTSLLTLAGGDLDGYAQVGSGGAGSSGAITSNLLVTAVDGVDLRGGGADAHALLGGGGSRGGLSAITGDVAVFSAAGAITLTGGADRAFAQIGNGGLEFNGVKTGDVLVDAFGDVTLTAGTGSQAYTQIGHGGYHSSGANYGVAGEVVRVTSGGDIRLVGSDVGTQSSAMIGHGGVAVDTLVIAGDVVVVAEGDLTLLGGAADLAMAQIGNGGAGANGAKSGDTFAHADGDVSLQGGAGRDAYAKIGLGDWITSSVAGIPGFGSGKGALVGDTQVSAGENVVLTRAMIGAGDPALATLSPIQTGNTTVAVSRDDPSFTGTGALIGDVDSLIASAPSGELRLYLPSRASNQLESTRLNTTVYPGPNLPEPENQTLDEFVITQLLPELSVGAVPGEHADLADNVSGSPRWLANLNSATLTVDTPDYRVGSWGNYSLYYDTIIVSEAGAPTQGPDWSLTPQPGGGAGSAGAGGVVPELPGDGGGTPVVPVPVSINDLVYGLLFSRFSDLDPSLSVEGEVGAMLDDSAQDDEPSNRRKKSRGKIAQRPQYRYTGDREGWSSNEIFYEFDPEIDVNQTGPVVVE